MKISRHLWLLLALTLCWVTTATPAHADPITAAIVTWIGVTGTMAAVATFVINTALYTAGSFLLNKVAGAGRRSTQERQASVLQVTLGESDREYLFGEVATGGSLMDAANYGGKHGTDWEVYALALADHPIDQLVGFYAWDRFYAFSANGLQSALENGVDLQFVNATAGGSAPPARFASAMGWTSSDRAAGVTMVWAAFSAKICEKYGGRPNFQWVVRGARLYDPRKDSTVPGGSGSHRYGTPSTWEWSANLALARYAFQRGIYGGQQVDQLQHLWVGRGLSALEAPPERVIAAANLCDEPVALKAGGSQPRYHGGGIIRSGEDFARIEQDFADAMGGIVIQRDGGVDVEPGQAKATVAEITDMDLLIGEKSVFEEFLPDPQRINSVLPRYVEPNQKWSAQAAPVRRSVNDILTDGRPKEEPLELAFITNNVRAQRLGEMRRRLNRLERRAAIVLGPRFSALQEGDWIGWTSERYLGGQRRVFRLERFSRGPARRTALALREISSTAYDWDAPTDEHIPGTPPKPEPPSPGAVDLDGVTYELVSLGGVPAVRARYSLPIDPAVSGVRVEVRRLGEAEVAPTITDELTGVVDATNGVASEGPIEARLLPITAPHRTVAPVAWVEMVPGKIIGEPVDPDGRPIDLREVFSENWSRSFFGPLEDTTFAGSTVTRTAEGVRDTLMRVSRVTAGQQLTVNLLEPGYRIDTLKLKVMPQAIAEAQWDGRLRYQTAKHRASAAYEVALPWLRIGATLPRWWQWDIEAPPEPFNVTHFSGATFGDHWTTVGSGAPGSVAPLPGSALRTLSDGEKAFDFASGATVRMRPVHDVAGVWEYVAEFEVLANPTGQNFDLRIALSCLNGSYTQLGAPFPARKTTGSGALGMHVLTGRAAVSGESTSFTAGSVYIRPFGWNAAALNAGSIVVLRSLTARLVDGLDDWQSSTIEKVQLFLQKPGAPDLTFDAIVFGSMDGQIGESVQGNALGLANEIMRFNLFRDEVEDVVYQGGVSLKDVVGELSTDLGIIAEKVIDETGETDLARMVLVAEASGGRPALIALKSDSFGADVAIDADRIWWGNNTTFLNDTDQLVTVTDGQRRVLAFGAAFGSGPDVGQLTEWEGPDDVPMNAMTRENSAYYRANTHPRMGGPALEAVLLGFVLRQNKQGVTGVTTNSGATVTTATVTVEPRGYTGDLVDVEYAWSFVSGDSGWVITSPSGATTAFRNTVNTGATTKRGLFRCIATDSAGNEAAVTVSATVILAI